MNKKDAYKDGKQYGYKVSSWVDIPEVGDCIDSDIDYVGLGKRVTANNQWEYFELLCFDAVENSKQYTEFSFIASDINDCPNADRLWESFEEGIDRGITQRINEVKQ